MTYWKQPVNQPQRPARKARLITIPGGEYAALTEAPYISYWVQDTQQPLRNRIPKRQQPMPRWNPWYATQQTAATPSVAGWAEPTSQPERHRWLKRQQPMPVHVLLPAQLNWKQPANQPLRNRTPKRQQPRYAGQFYPPLSSAPPYISYWVQPTNQPLRSRTPKRQQPRYPGQFYPPIPSEPPYLSYWKQPTNQPRPPRKARLVEISGGEYSSAVNVVVPLLPMWVQPTNQPLRARVPKRQQPPKAKPPFPPLASQAPYLSYWVQPTNEPLRGRIPKRQQPRAPQPPEPPRGSAAPYLSYWVQPTNEPLRARIPKRQQPKQAWNPWWATTAPPAAPVLSSWVHPTNEPLRARTPRRQQINKALPPFPPIASAAPYLSYWKQPVSEPLRRTKRQQPMPRWNPFYSIPTQTTPSVASWMRPIEQPLRSRTPKRQQVARTPVKFTCGFSFIQTKQTNGVSTTSLVIMMSQAMLVNDLAVVNIKFAGTPGKISVTDDKGNIYADTGAQIVFSNYQWYGVQTIGGATQITVSWQNTVSSRVTVDEFSGGQLTNAAIFDKAVTASGNSNSASVPAFSPFTTGELISVGVVWTGTISAGLGYNLSQSNPSQAVEYKIASDASETAPMSSSVSGGWTELAGAYVPRCVQLTPKVPTWMQPVNQPLRGRTPKRQQPQWPIKAWSAINRIVPPPGIPVVLQDENLRVSLEASPYIIDLSDASTSLTLEGSSTDERLSSEDTIITLE